MTPVFLYRKERNTRLCWEIIHQYQVQFSGPDFCSVVLKNRYWFSKKWKSWRIQAWRIRWVYIRGNEIHYTSYLNLHLMLWFGISGIWLIFEISSTSENVWRCKIFAMAKEVNPYSNFNFEEEYS